MIDPGDGSALPNYVASFPATVTAVLKELRETTGIDVTGIINPHNGVKEGLALRHTPDASGHSEERGQL